MRQPAAGKISNSLHNGHCILVAVVLACALPQGAWSQVSGGASSIADRLVRLTAHRFGVAPSCAVAFFAGSPGLLLTTYEAIRGADRLEVATNDGRDLTDRTMVASYNTIGDLAVLHTSEQEADTVPLGTTATVTGGLSAWGFGGESTAQYGAVSVTSRENVVPHSLHVTEVGLQCYVGAPLVDRRGVAAGIVARRDAAIDASSAETLLTAARQNIATGRLKTAAEVADAERHLYGSALLEADVSGSLVRVEPLESWHWPELVEERQLPFTFNGPMGRYQVEFLAEGSGQNPATLEILPGAAIRIRLFPGAVAESGGGKLPWVLGVVGAAAAGTALVLSPSGGGGTTPPPPPPTSPGSIVVTFPKYIPRS